MTVVLIVSRDHFLFQNCWFPYPILVFKVVCCLFRQLRALSTGLFGLGLVFLFCFVFLTVFAFWKFLLGGAGIESK